MVSGKFSTNIYAICTCVAEIMASNGSLSVSYTQFSGTLTFPGSGAVKRFVITIPVHQVSTANIKFEAAEGLGNMTG